MKNYIYLEGKKIEISEETAENLKEQFNQKETPSSEVAIKSYKYMCDINWDEKEEVLIKDKPKKMIFVNKKFADNSEFGDNCVFIKCKFGSCCKFGNLCKFGSRCEFGSGCKFESGCKKQFPYWDENGKQNN